MTFEYFAYGSNMFEVKLTKAAPTASFYSIGRVIGYMLRFNKQSRDGSGKANIVATGVPTDEVWGVIYTIVDADRASLDRSELGYTPTEIDVVTAARTMTALTYVAEPATIDETVRPYIWYKDFVVRGALQHRLPEAYVAQLQAAIGVKDMEDIREQENVDLVRTAESTSHDAGGVREGRNLGVFTLSEEAKAGDGFRIGVYGPTESGLLRIAARQSTYAIGKDADEVEVAEKFCTLARNGLTRFLKPRQASEIDVVGVSEDKTRRENFQVTVLFDGNFWKSLNARGAGDVQLDGPEVIELVRRAVMRKKEKYPLAIRQTTVLLVDTAPAGLVNGFVHDVRWVLATLLREAEFKEIWLVGSTVEQVFRIWPF